MNDQNEYIITNGEKKSQLKMSVGSDDNLIDNTVTFDVFIADLAFRLVLELRQFFFKVT